MRRKTTVLIFPVINKQNLTREELKMTKNEKTKRETKSQQIAAQTRL